jgi:low affinity Fe/Cu permease
VRQTRRKVDLERISDVVTNALGSTISVIAHSALFVAIFGLWVFGVGFDEILLILTTAVSLEAIYLSIFIQRSTNRQAVRIESAVDEIRRNTEETLVRLAALTKQEIDDVQGAVEDIDEKIEEIGQRIEAAVRASKQALPEEDRSVEGRPGP